MPSDSRLASLRWSLACSSASRRICSTRVPSPERVGRLFSSSCLFVSVSFCSSAAEALLGLAEPTLGVVHPLLGLGAGLLGLGQRGGQPAEEVVDLVAVVAAQDDGEVWLRVRVVEERERGGLLLGHWHILADAPGCFARACGPCRSQVRLRR